eukprot:6478477-Pyramimonas_sp.AAC.1
MAKLKKCNSGLARLFLEQFPGYTELYQTDPTHRTYQQGNITSVARLDRIYCSLYAEEILDLCPLAGVSRGVFDCQLPSDHALVFCALRHPEARCFPRIPSW